MQARCGITPVIGIGDEAETEPVVDLNDVPTAVFVDEEKAKVRHCEIGIAQPQSIGFVIHSRRQGYPVIDLPNERLTRSVPASPDDRPQDIAADRLGL